MHKLLVPIYVFYPNSPVSMLKYIIRSTCFYAFKWHEMRTVWWHSIPQSASFSLWQGPSTSQLPQMNLRFASLSGDLIGKDSDAGRDCGQEEKGTTEDEMAGWHHWLDGRESEWNPGVGDGQGGLACCDSWGRKESDTTEWLNWTELNWTGELREHKKLSPLYCVPRSLGWQWPWNIQDSPDITQQLDIHEGCCNKDSLSPNLRCSLMPGVVGQIWPNACFCMAQELRMALTSLRGKNKSKEEYIKMWKWYEIHISVSNKFHSSR